jgi:hypothetical protein
MTAILKRVMIELEDFLEGKILKPQGKSAIKYSLSLKSLYKKSRPIKTEQETLNHIDTLLQQ